MSVLVCPVCHGSMREMNRGGVVIDICTQCRGVWLDRGELEKLASVVTPSEDREFLGDAFRQRRDRRQERDDDDDEDRRYGYERQRQRRKSFLDFFD